MRMTRREFQEIVTQALDELPEPFQEVIHNLDIQVRWAPSPYERRRARLRPGMELFGLYTGVPLTARGARYGNVLPDVITLYQRTHERFCATDAEMVEQARQTLLHEIGHYMGIDEDRLHELGVG